MLRNNYWHMALVITACLLAPMAAKAATEKWFMVNAQGQCVPMELFDSIGPPTHTPDELFAVLKQGGVQVTMRKLRLDKGPAVILEISEKRYPMLFANQQICNGTTTPPDIKPGAYENPVRR